MGLVDNDATVHVLPYEVGLQLGVVWDDRRANIRLAGLQVISQPYWRRWRVGDRR
jgi:hypothetical protein